MSVTCSIIGSFRKHYSQVLGHMADFHSAGIAVLSPKDAAITNPEAEFVRFDSDDSEHSEADIQLIALHRILRSTFVYVANPGGYVGRTTCYEIGRILERSLPIFFSEAPLDLPIPVSREQVITSATLAQGIYTTGRIPNTTHDDLPTWTRTLITMLQTGEYVD